MSRRLLLHLKDAVDVDAWSQESHVVESVEACPLSRLFPAGVGQSGTKFSLVQERDKMGTRSIIIVVMELAAFY